MSKFRFEGFVDNEDGQMAHVCTLGEEIPLNILIDNADLFDDLKDGHCDIEVYGVTETLNVFSSEEAYYGSGTHLAEPSLIPIGTFPLNGNEDTFEPSADIIFSGKVLGVKLYPCSEEDAPNCCLRIETIGFEFCLYLRYEGEVHEGDLVWGRAWLYGELIGKGSRRKRTHIPNDAIDDKLYQYCRSYVRITDWNGDKDEGQIDDYIHRGDSDRTGFSFICGCFIDGGPTFYYEDEICKIERIEGTEAEIVRGKITGDTIEEYLSLLNNEQISFISNEMGIGIANLLFLPKDKINEIIEKIADIEYEDATVHVADSTVSARQRTAKDIISVWGMGKSHTGDEPEIIGTGVSHNDEVYFPCGTNQFKEFATVIRELRDLKYELLSVSLHGFHNRCLFIQTVRIENKYMVEIALSSHKSKPRIYRKYVMSALRCISIFRKVCILGIIPDLSDWRYVSRELFQK